MVGAVVGPCRGYPPPKTRSVLCLIEHALGHLSYIIITPPFNFNFILISTYHTSKNDWPDTTVRLQALRRALPTLIFQSLHA